MLIVISSPQARALGHVRCGLPQAGPAVWAAPQVAFVVQNICRSFGSFLIFLSGSCTRRWGRRLTRTTCSPAPRWTRTSSSTTTPRRSSAPSSSTRWENILVCVKNICFNKKIYCLLFVPDLRGGAGVGVVWHPVVGPPVAGPEAPHVQRGGECGGEDGETLLTIIILKHTLTTWSPLQVFAMNMWKKFQSWKVVGFSNLPQFLQVMYNDWWIFNSLYNPTFIHYSVLFSHIHLTMQKSLDTSCWRLNLCLDIFTQLESKMKFVSSDYKFLCNVASMLRIKLDSLKYHNRCMTPHHVSHSLVLLVVTNANIENNN